MPAATRKPHITYHSSQYQSTVVDGVETATQKNVEIRNGKGSITVKNIRNGHVRASTRRRLSSSQKKKILNNVFVPGLFRECVACNTRKLRPSKHKK
jgi:hypothetical protein